MYFYSNKLKNIFLSLNKFIYNFIWKVKKKNYICGVIVLPDCHKKGFTGLLYIPR